MKKILAINASYRNNGITDQTVEALRRAVETLGGEVEVVKLREYPLEFCRNCRECTQQPGEDPGCCVVQDGMQGLIDKIEWADGYILASPTNFGSTTALFKRFMERLVVYAFWSWDMNAPQHRKANVPKKKAILVSSCAAPWLLGRWLYGTRKQLKMTAKTIGAETVGTIFTGLIGKESHPKVNDRVHRKTRQLAKKLI
jgi:multimeric flavodoxin WrbA